MDSLPWPAITAASGGWVLTGAFVIAVLRGRLVPRANLEDAHHEANEWRTEGRIKDQQIAEKDVQLGHLAEVGKTVEQLARGLQEHGGLHREVDP